MRRKQATTRCHGKHTFRHRASLLSNTFGVDFVGWLGPSIMSFETTLHFKVHRLVALLHNNLLRQRRQLDGANYAKRGILDRAVRGP